MRRSGTAMCIASGAAFGAMAIFGKLAYGAGVTVGTLLPVRFALAAALFWVLLLVQTLRGSRESAALPVRSIRGPADATAPPVASIRGSADATAPPVASIRGSADATAPPVASIRGSADATAPPVASIRGSGDAAAPAIRSTRRRDVALAFGLGAFGYSVQAGCYFAALERIDASLLSLLLYTFPAMVAVAAVALGRERLEGRRLRALCLALAGILLVVAGAGTGTLDGVGVALGVTAALVYTTYILVSDSVVGRVQPLVLSALVCTGAAVSLTLGSALLGQLHLGRVTAAGWFWLACIAAVSTVAAIVLFFAGLRRAGPTSASILATVEPVVTVLLAFLVFGETLGALQLLGGVFVLTAVVVLSARRNLPDTAEWTQGRARSTRPRAAPASGRRPRYSPLSYLKEIPSRTR